MKKDVRFGLVLTKDEKTALGKLAESEGGLSEAATLRRLIRRTAHERGFWQPTVIKSQSNEVTRNGNISPADCGA